MRVYEYFTMLFLFQCYISIGPVIFRFAYRQLRPKCFWFWYTFTPSFPYSLKLLEDYIINLKIVNPGVINGFEIILDSKSL